MADLLQQTRGSRAARALVLAFGAAFVMALPAQTAAAQPLLPPLEDCVADPLSCVEDPPDLPPLPEADTCVQNPASCLPAAPPEVDECVANPAGCDVPVPSVDRCLEHPNECLPQTPKADRCVQDPAGCITEPERDDPKDSREEEDGAGSAVPGDRDDQPRGPREAGTAGDIDVADAGTSASSSPTEAPATEVAAAPASTDVLGSIGRGVADAARRFAFPIAVAGFAAIFLLVQGRSDRRDPKLVAAPIDSRDDVVPFR